MEQSVVSLQGSALRYMLAKTLQMEPVISCQPTYGVGIQVKVPKYREFFQPDKNWAQAGPLIEQHFASIGTWLERVLGEEWRFEIQASNDDALLWFMRAIVGYHNNNVIWLPVEYTKHLKTV